MKLHELTEDYKAIQDEDLPEDVLMDTLEAIEGEIQIKGENIALLIQNWESDINALTDYKKKLDLKIQQRKNRIQSLKDYLRMNMEATGIKKIECPLFSITCAKGRAVVAIESEDDLPDEFVSVSVVTKPDKKKILDALKNGEEVKGALMSESQSSIRIK